MLNEDELRDAILLVFANKQDLPVSIPKQRSPGALSSPANTNSAIFRTP
jgi:hypothetical protein